MNILDCLNARQGVVSFVGAGGKKSALYRIAQAHHSRVAITATAHIEKFRNIADLQAIVGTEDEILSAINQSQARIVGVAQPSSKPGRFAGIGFELLQQLIDLNCFDVVLVKADGARGRLAKAPKEGEPPVPPQTTTVIPVISVKVIGQVLSEQVVHRVEYFSQVTGMQPGEIIQPEHLATLLSSIDGALRNVGDATVIPLITMVSDKHLEHSAREVAHQALTMTQRFNRIVLAEMSAEQPIVCVVE